MKHLTSKNFRTSSLFLRNSFPSQGKYNIPLIRRQNYDISNISLIACSNTKNNDTSNNISKGVHFFVDDYRFNGIFNNPERSLDKFSQYAFLLSPDFSTYQEMPLWRQIESVAKNRWCGAYWQSKGKIVFPTISWSNSLSYDFCFNGVEKNSIVAVGMIGCKNNKKDFMRGYNEMLDRIEPQAIICVGSPFNEMEGNLIICDYMDARKGVR